MTTDDERKPAETETTDDDAIAGPDDAGEQDFALRNTMMSNAMPGSGQPAAGAVVGSEGRLGMQPETDEEAVDEAGGEVARD